MMKKIIVLLILTPSLLMAAQLRIDLVVLNDSGTATSAVNSISYTVDQTDTLQQAVDALQGVGGSSIIRLRKQLMTRVKELVRSFEENTLFDLKLQEAQAAISALPEFPSE